MLQYPILLYRGEQFDANFYYFAKCDIDHAFLLLTENEKTLFVPKMNEESAREVFDGQVVVYENASETLKKKIKNKKIGVDYASISMRLFEKLKVFCKPMDVSEELSVKRSMKNEDEVKKIASAAIMTKKIFDSLESTGFSKMRTENDVKRFLLKETLELEVEQAFEPIVATDKNASFPHYRGGNAKLGDFVLIDYAVKFENYCADLTRCFFLNNSKKNKKIEEQYKILQEITNKIIFSMNKKEFKYGKDVANYSELLIKEYKLPEMIHSIGHGVGLEIHEMPRLSKKSKDKISGTTLAIEPACYFKDYGLRFEETAYFDGKNARIL